MKGGFFYLWILAAVIWFAPATAQAATTTMANGTVTYPDGSAAQNVSVEIHNGNGSLNYRTTTNSSGAFTLQLDDDQANGEMLTVEVTAPTSYLKPTNSPHNFTYTKGAAVTTVNFQLISAPKTITVNVQTTTGAIVERFDAQALPLGSATASSASINANGSTGTLNVTGGKWAVTVNRNLSEQDPTRYPWVPLGGAQEVEFADNNTTETATLTFTVAASDELVKIKPVDVNGAMLTQNSFNGDVTFVGFTEFGAISTYAKVNQSSGEASLYLPPGIYHVNAFHQQLANQSFDPKDATFVIGDTNTTHDLGILQAEENTGRLEGIVKLLEATPSGIQIQAKTAANLTVQATNLDTGNSGQSTTDDKGKFAIANLGAGTYSVAVHHDDYIARQTVAVKLQSGETQKNLELSAVSAPLTLSGKVVDANGTAINSLAGNVVVEVGEEKFSAPVAADGTYEVNFYNPGKKQAILELTTQKGAEVFQSVDANVTLGNQDNFEKNITTSDQEGMISGNIKDVVVDTNLTSSTLGNNATVTAMNIADGSVEEVGVNNDGSFELSVGPGEWKLVPKVNDVDTDAFSGFMSDDIVTVVAGDEVNNIDVSLYTKKGAATGLVENAQGDPVVEERIMITNQPALEAAAKQNNTTINPEEVITVVAKTDKNGNFLTDLPNGDFTAYFSDNPNGGAGIAPEAVEFTVNNNTADLGEFQFANGDATISGKVDKQVTEGKVVFYNDVGTTVKVDIDDKQKYEAELPSGKWTAVFSGVENGEIVMNKGIVNVKSRDKILNFPKANPTGIDLPAAAQVICDAAEPCVVTNTNGAEVHLSPYAAALEGTITVQLTPLSNVEISGDQLQIGGYEVTVWDSNGFEVSQLQRPIDITLPVADTLLTKNTKADELEPVFLNPELNLPLSTGIVGEASKKELHIQTTHLTPFAVATAVTNFIKAPKAVKMKSLKVRKVTHSTAMLAWKKPRNSQTSYYQVQVRAQDKTVDKKVRRFNNVSRTSKKVTKLKAVTDYKYRLRSCNAVGCGKYSAWKEFSTK